MSKLQHTPGPWRHQHDKNGEIIFAGISEVICFTQLNYNARLIAAAPEMLEALIKILKTEGSIESINNMISTIERATGLTIEEVLKCTE